MSRVTSLEAWEILDSRGLPTVLARCRLAGGGEGSASVPSGRSTGRWEAAERRDGDSLRYGGLGCLDAVAAVNGEIAGVLRSTDVRNQAHLDEVLVEIDGTGNKSRLGANAILAVSIAFARAQAAGAGRPLWEHLASEAGNDRPALPALTVNLFSGGKHAGGQVPIQDVLVVPQRAYSIDAALVSIRGVFAAAAELIGERYGARLLTADEGGLAPDFGSVDEMFEAAVASIDAAGLEPSEMALAVDVAASHFSSHEGYDVGGEVLSGAGMVAAIDEWVGRYPIVSVEDGLGEDDWEHWPMLREALDGRALVVGDDLLCTNPGRIDRAVRLGAADALLLKVNQIGTLTEARRAYEAARAAGWKVVVSARSGETEDSWLADLAVGWSGDYIKVGSVTQSERLAKYNRLLVIEAESGLRMVGT